MAEIFIAGHNGMVGTAIFKKLSEDSNNKILVRSRKELDLQNQHMVENFFRSNDIQEVYLAAAKVGGILSNNSYPSEFLYSNLQIQTNVIMSAFNNGVKKLLFLGSSCIYPKFAEQPIKESSILSGFLEPTNEPYAIAKIAGLKLCESLNRQYDVDYRIVMPTNLYGPGDNFNDLDSHVIPGLMRRIHEAKENKEDEVIIWGTGNPRREFLHVDEMAEASIFIMNMKKEDLYKKIKIRNSHINVGCGDDYKINEIAKILKNVIGYEGKFKFDKSKEDGTPRKLLDVDLINSLGWKSSKPIQEGLEETYAWFLKNIHTIRK